MSEVKRYTLGCAGSYAWAYPVSGEYPTEVEESGTQMVMASDYDATISQFAALREELATSRRNEHNSEVAYKAAIEKQEELRAELADLGDEFDTLENSNVTLKLSLADAERRNATMRKAIEAILPLARMIGTQEELDLIDAALNPIQRPQAMTSKTCACPGCD